MAEKYVEYTKIIKKSGIKVSGAFIFGFDSDNLKSFLQLWKFCFSIMPVSSHLGLLTPFPGSGLYRDMLRQNRIINLNWRKYNAGEMVFDHPYLNPKWVSFFFPLFRIFFFLTTSWSGFMLLLILISLPQYRMVDHFFR